MDSSHHRPRFALGLILFSLWAIDCLPAAEPTVSFSRDVLPILSDHCFHCHGPDGKTREADLRLDVAEGALRQENPVILPHDSHRSMLLQRILSQDPNEVMPPSDAKRRLSKEEISTLRNWIDQGAAWGKHWAYELPARVSPSGGASPIDSLIEMRLRREGLVPAPPASRETLIRRLTYDLTGLPPSIQEIDDFLLDSSPDAFEKVVDRLLQSPRFGQRMAWDWLDAARYADTNGYQGDPERTMWPWRDWVVDALNADLPYDRFTIDQLAGDLVPNPTREQRLATGFHRNNMHNGEGGRIPEETRVENIFDRVETTATIWLGATFTCCRCHDHKFDPFTMRDYYGMYDIFNQMSETGQGRDGRAAPTIDFSTADEEARVARARKQRLEVAAEVEAFERIKFPRPEGKPLSESIAAELPGNLPATLAKVEPKNRKLPGVLEAIGYFETDGDDPQYVLVLKKLLAALREEEAATNGVTKVMIMDQLKTPRITFVLSKGAYDKPTDIQVEGSLPQSLVETEPTDAASASRLTRLDLAKWLVSPKNPLAARVTVNRLWQGFFGVGLVKTVEDFGVQGEKPSHPELLDWLASELIRRDWDIKGLCRTIVLSETYQRSSNVSAELAEHDPENRLLARGPRFRLPSWMIRDAALAVSGLLVDEHRGPSVKPYQPEGIWEEATFGKKAYQQDHGPALYRRTLYVYWRRIVGPTMLFDNAARQTCTVKNVRTNTPLHALVTLNDVTYVEAARNMAQRVMLSESHLDDRLNTAFRLVTSRRPTHAEHAILKERWRKLCEQYRAAPEAARQLLEVGESQRAKELDVIEHAAFTGLCSLLLNLDEALTKE